MDEIKERCKEVSENMYDSEDDKEIYIGGSKEFLFLHDGINYNITLDVWWEATTWFEAKVEWPNKTRWIYGEF